MSTKKHSTAAFAQFSEDAFRRGAIDKVSKLTLVGAVTTNRDYLVIEPYPCDKPSVFRIASGSVEVSENSTGM